MKREQAVGIASNPVLFGSDGNSLPPDPRKLTNDPQSLWASLEGARDWSAYNILGLEVAGIQNGERYIEPSSPHKASERLAAADQKREDDERYTDQRNADSLAAFLGVGVKSIFSEFTKRSVLEVGSGAGRAAEDFRRNAKAIVTEVDFSLSALKKAGPIHGNRGARIAADGLVLPFSDGAFERVVSMYSTSVHTDTIRTRLQGLTEGFRVTQPGGRYLVVPLFGNKMHRNERWHMMHQHEDIAKKLGVTEQEVQDFIQVERQEAAIDHALITLLATLMKEKVIAVTPRLILDKSNPRYVKDITSAVIDVNRTLSAPEANELIEEAAAPFQP